MPSLQELKAAKLQRGRPLYLAVRDAMHEAIDTGMFRPGEQMPSTKNLSEQLSVSLVTAHRALQELVTSGVLQRSQGRGTFVHDQYRDRRSALGNFRLGLFLPPQAPLDYNRSQIVQGLRIAAAKNGADLLWLRLGEDLRNECDGFVFIDPLIEQISHLLDATRRRPAVLVGAASSGLADAVEIDAIDLARRGVDHLFELGHRKIGYLGPDQNLSAPARRWAGYIAACERHELHTRQQDSLHSLSSRLDPRERAALVRMLTPADRPTALFVDGQELALDVYAVAAELKLSIPRDLSVIAVDDAPAAAFLSPALTTLRQPLEELGDLAIKLLYERAKRRTEAAIHQTVRGELIIRDSTSHPKTSGDA